MRTRKITNPKSRRIFSGITLVEFDELVTNGTLTQVGEAFLHGRGEARESRAVFECLCGRRVIVALCTVRGRCVCSCGCRGRVAQTTSRETPKVVSVKTETVQ